MTNQFDMQNQFMGIPNMYNPPRVNPYTVQQPISIVKVNGKNGAEAYQMPANSSILLLDTTKPVVWLKQTDGAGYPTLSGYSISPIKDDDTINNSDDRLEKLENRIKNLERRMKKDESKSNSPDA